MISILKRNRFYLGSVPIPLPARFFGHEHWPVLRWLARAVIAAKDALLAGVLDRSNPYLTAAKTCNGAATDKGSWLLRSDGDGIYRLSDPGSGRKDAIAHQPCSYCFFRPNSSHPYWRQLDVFAHKVWSPVAHLILLRVFQVGYQRPEHSPREYPCHGWRGRDLGASPCRA